MNYRSLHCDYVFSFYLSLYYDAKKLINAQSRQKIGMTYSKVFGLLGITETKPPNSHTLVSTMKIVTRVYGEVS
jgi:hypothetical protein